MGPIIADRVKETSATQGTGALTLVGAVPGFRAFSAVCAVGDVVLYTIEASDGTWEVGVGSYSATNTLSRTTVLASSNAGALVNFTATTKYVWIDAPALTFTPGCNLLHNGADQVWQRGGGNFVAGASAVFGPDRWQLYRTGFVAGATGSRQTGDKAQYCTRIQRDNGNASTANIEFAQALESIDSIPCRGQRLTLRFRARCGALFSAASSLLNVRVNTGTGTDERPYSFTGGANAINQNVTLTTAWQEFVLVTAAVIPNTATQLGVLFAFVPVGTAGASDYFEIEERSLQVGIMPTGRFPYRTYQEELANAQRFLPCIAATGANSHFGSGHWYSTTAAQIFVRFPVRARIAPTGVTVSAGSHFGANDGVGNQLSGTAVALNDASPEGAAINITGLPASGAAGNGTNGSFRDAAASAIFTGAEI